MEKLLRKSFIEELKLDGTYNDSSFSREYESEWSGDAENAFFSSEKFDKYRVLLQPEYEFSGRNSKTQYYVLGVDVGRIGCTTEVSIIKVTPQVQGADLKSLVNIYTYEAEDFEMQSINIKKLYNKYKARIVSVDILADDEYSKEAFVIVPDDQLSLAIGRDGQNVRLAHKLTGWKIDIKSESQAEKMEIQHQSRQDEVQDSDEDEVDEIAEEIREQEEYAVDEEDMAQFEGDENQEESTEEV